MKLIIHKIYLLINRDRYKNSINFINESIDNFDENNNKAPV